MALIVYDVTSDKTFKEIDRWITDVKEQRSEEVIIFLIANKVSIILNNKKNNYEFINRNKDAWEYNTFGN